MRIALIVVLIAGLCTLGHADSQVAPWSVGVTEAKKTEANRLLEAGNALFLDKKYSEALAKYRQAVAAWDHPAIRFNIVRCLIQLDRPVEASENLKQALRYGAAPLEEAVYAEAVAYEKLLAKQVGTVTIACAQRGVEIALDGQRIACPTTQVRQLAPGKHPLVGTGAGLLARTLDVFVVGGEEQRVEITLDPAPRAGGPTARTYGKIAAYAGGGLLLASAGLGLFAWRSYRGQFPDHCTESATGGRPTCDESGSDALDRAILFGDLSTVAAAAGGVAVVAGLFVMWRYPNKEHTVVTPTASAGSVGLAVRGAF